MKTRTFRYEAREPSGTAVRGDIEAPDRREALRQLSARGLFPSTLEEGPAASSSVSAVKSTETRPPVPKSRERSDRTEASSSPAASQTFRPASRVKRREITAFTREIATLLEADIPILSALQGLKEQEESEGLRSVVDRIMNGIRQGRSFSEALEELPDLFSPLYVSMVKVGEEAGVLDQVMSDLSDLRESEDEMRGEVLGAVAYPAFVLVMGFVTAFVLMAFVLPRLFDMLADMMDVMPMPTRILLGISDFFQANWVWIIVGVAAAGFAMRSFIRSPDGGLKWDTWKLQIPLMGQVFRAATLGRFARTLGTLTKSGVSLLPALNIVRNTVGNRRVAQIVDRISEDTRGGNSIATPLREASLFPPTMVQMISVGEDTGRLDTMLLRVASIQERQLRSRSKTLISLLAPALILIVGGLVGFIVIALLLPIFQMSSAMG
ncbi:MAG: type II secretion system F family protein [Planctomycetota bacterium]